MNQPIESFQQEHSMGMVTHVPVSANDGRKRVLIVDDDAVVRLVYMNNFKAAGFEVESAPDGASAWTKLQKRCPDAILLDLILPKGGGLDLLKKVRAQGDSPLGSVPVFVLTNAFLCEMSEEASRSGAHHVFDKAVTTPAGIVAAIRKELGLGNDPSGPPVVPLGSGEDGKLQPDSTTARYFIFQMPQRIAAARKKLQEFLQAADDTARQTRLLEFYHKVHAMTGSASSAGLSLVAQQCASLEALLKALHENPSHLNASTRRTITQAVATLELVFERAHDAEQRCQTRPFQVLVVNDDAIAREAMSRALERVHFRITHVGDAAAARQHLEKTPADLIILDLNQPQATRAEVSLSLRAAPASAGTPAVFLTSHLQELENFEPADPDDLIAKPFIFMELAVKATALCVKARMTDANFRVAAPASADSAAKPSEPLAMPSPSAAAGLQSVYAAPPPASSSAAPELPAAPAAGHEPTAAPPSGLSTFGIITFDETWRIESINPVAATLFGYAPIELAGLSIETLIPAGLPPSFQAFVPGADAPKSGETKDCWLVGRRKDGTQFPLNLMLKGIVVGKYRRITGIIRGLDQMVATGQRQANYDQGRLERVEAQLAQARTELEKALAARQESERRLAELLNAPPLDQPALAANAAPSPASDELRRQIDALNAEMAKIKAELERETNRRTQAEQLAKDFSEVAADFEKRLEGQPAAPASRPGHSGAAEQELAKVRADLSQELTRRQHLEKQVALLSEANTKFQHQLGQPPASEAARQQSLQELATRIHSVTTELVKTRADLQKEAARRQQVTEEASRLLTANTVLQTQVEQLRQGSQQVAELDQKCHALTEEAAQLRAELGQKQSRQQQVETQLADLKARHEVLSQQLLQQECTASALADEREELERRQRQAQAELQQAATASEQHAVLAQQAEKTAQELAAVKSQLADESSRREQLEGSLSEISNRAKSLTDERDQVREAETGLRQQGEELRKRLEENLTLRAQMEEQLREAASEHEQLTATRARVTEMEQEQTALAARLADLEKDLALHREVETDLRQRGDSLQTRLTDTGAKLGEAEIQLRIAAEEREQLAAARARVSALEQEQSNLSERLATLEKDLAQSRQAESQFRQQAESLQVQLAGNGARLAQAETQLCDALAETKQLATVQEQLDSEHALVTALEQEKQVLTTRFTALDAELARTRQAEAELREQGASLRDCLADSGAKLQETEHHLAAERAQHTATQEQLAAERARGAALEQEKQGLAARIAALDAELTRLHQVETELAQQGEILQARLTETSSKLQETETQFEAERAQLAAERARAAALQEEQQTLTARLAALDAELGHQGETLQVRITESSSKLQETETQLQAERVQLASAHAQLAAERARAAGLQQEQQTLTARLTTLDADLARTRKAEAELRQQGGTFQARLAASGAKLEETENRLLDEVEQLTAARARAAALIQEQATLAERLGALDQELTTSRQTESELRQQDESLRARLTETAAALAQAENQLSTAAAENERLSAAGPRVNALEEEQENLTARLTALDAELARTRQAETELRQQGDSLQARLTGTATALAQAEDQLRVAALEREQLAAARVRVNELEQKQDGLTAQLAALDHELARTRRAEAELRQQGTALQARLSDNGATLLKVETQLRDTAAERDQLASARARVVTVEQELARQRESEARLQKSYQDLQSRCEDLTRSLSRAATELQEAQLQSQRAAFQQKSIAELRRQRDEWEQLFVQSQQALETTGKRLKQETAQRELLEQGLKEVREQVQVMAGTDTEELGRLAVEFQQASSRYDEASAALAKAQEEIRQAASRSSEMSDDFRVKLSSALQAVLVSLNALPLDRTRAVPAPEGDAAIQPPSP